MASCSLHGYSRLNRTLQENTESLQPRSAIMSPSPQWSSRGPAPWPSALSALPHQSTDGTRIIAPIHLNPSLILRPELNGAHLLGLRYVNLALNVHIS